MMKKLVFALFVLIASESHANFSEQEKLAEQHAYLAKAAYECAYLNRIAKEEKGINESNRLSNIALNSIYQALKNNEKAWGIDKMQQKSSLPKDVNVRDVFLGILIESIDTKAKQSIQEALDQEQYWKNKAEYAEYLLMTKHCDLIK